MRINNNNLREELKEINRNELDQIMGNSHFPDMISYGKEIVVYNKDALVNVINSINSNITGPKENLEEAERKVFGGFKQYYDWRKSNEGQNFIQDEKVENFRKNQLVTDIVNENKEIQNSDLSKINEYIHNIKPTIDSKIKNRPLGSAGDITVNELLNKGLEVFDTPLVQMIKDNVDIGVVITGVSTMILYKAVLKLYMKSAYSSSISEVIRSGASTRSKEIALFMIMGAPPIVGGLLTKNKLTSGSTKVIVNIAESNNLEGTITNSASSSSSLFLFLNKLPSWLKIILKYIALSLIITFITTVIGYKSTIIVEIYSQFYIYLGYFLKLYCVLNFLVIIYFIWKLYIIIMFANNKEFINPDLYPKFIKNEFLESKDIAINLYSVDPGKVYKHYFKLIFLYFSIVLFGLTMVILSSIYITP